MGMGVVPVVKGPECQVNRINICGHWGEGLGLSICRMGGLDWSASGLPRERGHNRKGPDSSRSNRRLGEWGVAGAVQGPRVIFCSSA